MSLGTVIVRAAAIADVPQTAVVAEASYARAFATILEPATLARYDTAFFAGRFVTALDRLRVAEGDGIVGFSLVTARHLDMLFVAPQAQASGAGRALLDEAVARGTTTLECFRDNLPARRFYERQGWRLTRAYQRDFAGRARDFVFYEWP